MYQPYMSLIQSPFPQVEIILDRFHLVQTVNREINRCRIKNMNNFRIQDKTKCN